MRKSKNKVVLLLAVVALFDACSRQSGLPAVNSSSYRELCSAFYTGLAGLQSGEDVRAKDDLTRASQLAPGEPAVWANLAIFQLRRGDLDAALQSAATARGLAPTNSRMEMLLGQIEDRRGETLKSLEHLKKAISLDGGNIKARYALVLETGRQGNDVEAQHLLEELLALRTANTGVLLDLARLSAKLGSNERLERTLQTLQSQSGNWPDAAKKQLVATQQSAHGANANDAAVQVQFLRNILLRTPGFQRDMDEIRSPIAIVTEPYPTFLRLVSPNPEPDPLDAQLRFEPEKLTAPGTADVTWSDVTWLGAIALDDRSAPSIVWTDNTNLHIGDDVVLKAPAANGPLSLHAIAGADLNYDFRTDLVIATAGGIGIYQQNDPRHFIDITAKTKLDTAIIRGSYTGAWAFDIDLDGDLDIVLGIAAGEPPVLRNNGDGTFTVIHPFKGVEGLLSFVGADLDSDGDPDAALIDGHGQLKVFRNERLGEYHSVAVPESISQHISALAASDVNRDGVLDIVVLRTDSSVVRFSARPDGNGWEVAELAHADSSSHDLRFADLDNNGADDLIVGDQVFLSDGKNFKPLKDRLQGNIRAIADLNQDGRLDLIGLAGQHAFALANHGTKNYHWQTIRSKAAAATGDQRINSFGIGGEIELRAGLLTQKKIIDSPILHFGLGEHTSADFARVVWPNGFVQAEFALKADQEVLAQQRLKGSCPFLFAWDGKRFQFVKDTAPWSPALGLRINAQQVAGIYRTQEWFKIPGNALVSNDGYYDLRVTAEYWETFYIDHYSLLVVDHPATTEIYSDERFALPPPPLKIYSVRNPKPFAHASDDDGHDATETVRVLDGRYLDNFGRGQYQGTTRDHWVELQLPEDSPQGVPLYLIAHGWMHPSDGTTNVALGQSQASAPQDLSIEVPDKDGRWISVRKNLGFPAGRLKTIVLGIGDIFQPGAARKLRLRTNLEIYWDKLEWATEASGDSVKTTHLDLARADLEYRGFSGIKQANLSSPEIPDYNTLSANGQRWRDMEGYFTRFGDVRELLQRIDDRMVIMNAGDELRLKFAAPPPPPAGWRRDYIMIGDGWIKDGDYNTVFSKTVLPLPYHGMKDYTVAPATLEQDPAYGLHSSDWQKYHTRYVTPKNFVTALWGQ